MARDFSSSEYSKTIAAIVAGEPPAIDLSAEKRLIDCLVAIASQGIAASAHDISDGGIAVTLAESLFVGARHAVASLGANVSLVDSAPAEHALFNERGARCIVSVAPENIAALQSLAAQYGVTASEIGQVTSAPSLRIEYKERAVIDSTVDSLRDIWANSLERTLAAK